MRTKTKATTATSTTTTSKAKSGTDTRKAKTKGTPPPAQCITARLTKKTAAWLHSDIYRKYFLAGDSPTWLIAGILASIGERAIRCPATARIIDTTVSSCLWFCINRDASEYTETVPVYLPPEELDGMTDDAKNVGRELADWTGTLIDIGLRVVIECQTNGKSLACMTSGLEFKLMANSAQLELLRQAAH